MVIRHFFLAFAACLVSIGHLVLIDAPAAVFDTIATGLRWLAAPLLGDTSAPRLASEGYVDFDSGGEPLDSALVNSLRHEAGMRPMRC